MALWPYVVLNYCGVKPMKKIIFTFLSVVLLVACSQQPTTNGKITNQKEELTVSTAPKAPTTLDEVLKRGAGRYGGKKYDKAKVHAELDKIPQNTPPEKVYNFL